MPEALEQIKNRFNDYIQGIEKKQKIKIATAIILALVTLTAIILYFTKPQYTLLYDNLDHKQAGEVMNVLQDNSIKAEYGDTSNTILVQKKDYQRAQVVVATQGLPQARFSYEDFFSGNSFMKTSEEKSQEYNVARGNELARIIEEIPGVDKAWVTLSIPETTGFVQNNRAMSAKASVFLNLKRNDILDNNSVKGIALLVSNAVPELEPENVSIHGSDGRVLNSSTFNEHSSDEFRPNEQLALQQTIKQDLENSIIDFLSTVYGYGNVVVMANVKLDFDSEVTEIQEFAPPIEGETEGIVRSMQNLQQKVVNKALGGVPGTDTNSEEVPLYVEGEEEESLYQEASETINYEIDELRRKIVKARGQVQDITVAVYINTTAITGGVLDDDEKKELESMISTAAGLDTRVVKVAAQEFNNTLENELRLAMSEDIRGITAIPKWLYGILAVILLGIISFVFVKVRQRRIAESIDEAPVTITEEIEEIELELAGSQVKQQLEKLVTKKPDAVAQLLKNWLSED